MALKRNNQTPINYYSSEIDKHANKAGRIVAPYAIELGDIRKINGSELPRIDLLIGGTPCTGFSFAGKQLNFEDPQSKLFFEFVRILKECKKVNSNIRFLLENVRMKKEYQDVISEHLGVELIAVNSNLVSAQNRHRLYWTNIEEVEQPEDKGIMLKDIVHEAADIKYNAGHDLIMNHEGGNQLNPNYKSQANAIHPLDGKVATLCAGTHGYANGYIMSDGWCKWWKKKAEYQLSKKYSSLNPDKAITMTARQYASWNGNFIMEGLNEYIVPFDKTLQILDKEVEKGKVGYFGKDSQANRVYYIHDKSMTLCGSAGGGAAKMSQYLFGHTKRNSQGDRVHNADEKGCALNASSGGTAGAGNMLFGCISPDRINKRQNGQRFNDGRKFYTLTAQDKHGILIEGYIRKLTPIECGRLQTVEDNVIINILNSGVSETQVYKMLGNGFTVDVISHILK